MTVVADEVGVHDTLGGACSKESNTLRYGQHTRAQHGCMENFLLEGARHGLSARDLASNINWFMNVPVDPDGALGIVDGLSAPGKRVAVRAEVWVETASQKGILIGKGGRMVREVGTAARRELERELGARVFLDLQVRVRARWRRDEALLDRLGIE